MKASAASSPATPRADRNSPTVERFRLTGPTRALDPRVNAARRDIADVALAADLFAPHYARPLVHGCALPNTPILAGPGAEARAVSELLLGESFAVVDVGGGWAWGYGLHDCYVGYVALEALAGRVEATHRVAALAALVFAEPDIKASVKTRLPMGAQVRGEAGGQFLGVEGGFIHRRHVRSLDAVEPDYASIAERVIGAPYRWGDAAGMGWIVRGWSSWRSPFPASMRPVIPTSKPRRWAMPSARQSRCAGVI